MVAEVMKLVQEIGNENVNLVSKHWQDVPTEAGTLDRVLALKYSSIDFNERFL